MKPVREGERRSRRKLGQAPEFKAEVLPARTRRPKVLVRACTCTSGGFDPWATTEFAECRGSYPCSKTGCFIVYTSYSFSIWRNNGCYRSGCGKWSILCRFGGGGSRAAVGGYRYRPSCFCRPCSRERLGLVLLWLLPIWLSFNLHCLTVCLAIHFVTEWNMSVRVRDDPGVIWGDPQSLRLRTYPLEVINCMLFLYLNLISNLYMQYLFNIQFDSLLNN